MSKNVTKFIYVREIPAQVSNIVFLAVLTVLRLFTTVWAKMSQNSYLREFCAQVSQIVFLADLNVLRLITTVWEKISQKSYFREFCSLMSQIVFLTYLTVLPFIKTVEQTCISATVHKCHKSCSLPSWPFYGLLQLYEEKCHETHISASYCTIIKNRVPNWFDRFTACWKCMRKKNHKTVSPPVLCTVWQIVFLGWFDRFTAY